MKLLIDDANLDKIREISEYFPIDGVTTNPSILAASGKQPYDVLEQIRRLIGPDKELHVQVISAKAEGMIEEARIIREKLGDNTYIKIPTVREGLKAMKKLKKDGVNITATAIYTPIQAYLAAQAGADYAAPYVNRIDNMGADGTGSAERIHDIFKKNGYKTEVLAASFKNTQQVLELCEYGVGAATIAPDVIEGLIKNVVVSDAVQAFVNDFEGLCGKDATMAVYKD